jgi:hypothetical protein
VANRPRSGQPVHRTSVSLLPIEVRKGFFFEKKKQKTFLSWGTGGETGTDTKERSFFCFFFVHKKEEPSLP